MLKEITCLFVFTQLYLSSTSQITFQIVYGDARHDEAKALLKSGNGFIMLGSSGNPGVDSSKIIFEKLDSAGSIILSSNFYINNLKNDYDNDVKTTPDGGMIICGTTYASNINPGTADVILIKTDQFGNVGWANVYGSIGSEEAYSVDICHGGGYFIAGASVSNTGNKSGFAMKVDASGNPVWYNANTILNNSRFNNGSVTNDGGFVTTGSTLYSSSKDLFVVRYDSLGNIKWSKRLAASGDQSANSITGTSDGGCIIAGSNSINGSANSTDLLVVRIDSSGTTLWAKTYNYLFEDVATDIIELSNGNFIISCYMNSTDIIAPVRSIGFLEVDSSGMPVSAHYYGSNTFDNFSNTVLQTNDGGFLIGGITYEYDPNGDAVLIKTDTSGGTHSCYVFPATFTESTILLTDSAGSAVTSALPNYSTISLNQDIFSTSFSPICFNSSVPNEINLPGINLFPNPVQNELSIQLGPGYLFESITVMDIFGRTIMDNKINANENNIHVNTGNFKPGIYQVQLRGKKNFIIKKFVKLN